MNAPQPPTDGEIEETSQPIELDRIVFIAYDAHTSFDTGQKRPDIPASYHNFNHISGANRFMEVVWMAKDHGYNPFDLSGEFERYKNRYVDPGLTGQDLRNAFLVALTCHDLGNITRSADIDNIKMADQQGMLDFSNRQLGDTQGTLETRSADIAENLIREFSLSDWSKRESFIALVRHLIMQTEFDPNNPPDEPPPFWRVMQVVDQIGAPFYSDQPYPEALMEILCKHYCELISKKKSANKDDITDFIY